MPKDESNGEITVRAPTKPVVSPKKKAEKTTQKALEEERYGILQVPKKIGNYVGIFTATIGVTLLLLIAYTSTTTQVNWLLLSSGSSIGSLVLWFLIGGISILSGLLLIGSE